MRERARAVHNANALFLEVLQVAKRVEDSVAIAALPGRWAHTVEDERILGGRGRIVLMISRVHAEPVCSADIELIEKRDKPGLLLVKDADWFLERSCFSGDGHKSPSAHEASLMLILP